MTGREKLQAAVDADVKRGSRSKEDCQEKFDWAIARAEHYAEKTGLDADEILNKWEEKRNYWYMNFYQESNQPEIKEDNVHIFETLKEAKESMKEMKFRCPACEQVSTDPYKCTSGHVTKGKECDWKVYGLFGDMGKGAWIFVKDQLVLDNLFMPVAWEE